MGFYIWLATVIFFTQKDLDIIAVGITVWIALYYILCDLVDILYDNEFASTWLERDYD